jgi:recombination protein RecA
MNIRTSKKRSSETVVEKDAAEATLEEALGDMIVNLDEEYKLDPKNVIPTGLASLDLALGVGGLPRGRLIEMFGREGGGKSSLSLHAIQQAQKLGYYGAIIDSEYSFDPDYAKTLGIDLSKLTFLHPKTGEQALGAIAALASYTSNSIKIGEGNQYAICVVDSVASLVPKQEFEKNIGDVSVGLQARMMSNGLRQIAGLVANAGMTVIFVNQLRENIGSWVSFETTPGGRALKFYAAIRLDVRLKEQIKCTDDSQTFKGPLGFIANVRIVKNRLANPFRDVEIEMLYGRGFGKGASLLDAALMVGLISRKGGSYYWQSSTMEPEIDSSGATVTGASSGILIGVGRNNVISMFEGNLKLPDGIPDIESMYKTVMEIGLDKV